MPILNRLRRLFRADLHAILDSMEDPESLLKQALREMEEALDQKQIRLGTRGRGIQVLESSCRQLEEKLGSIRQDLELALTDSSEEVCRKLIARKLALGKQLESVQQQVGQSRQDFQALEEELLRQQEEYDSIRERAEVLITTPVEDSPESIAEAILSGPPGRAAGKCDFSVSEEEIEMEWIRLRRNARGEA